ncbi:hypothetical protein [Undibacterium baiyunense]|uniref:Uncharacterized protein n=1 Tax=Undibacterium baiyunense TaxID=2828731 RepID=A0A941DEV7_9BURK|nr:hypothetical protein [Undibacterium baiyunense]MBR7747464.1 hypothetical protein [Undibacterium baiyunense]
MPTPTEIPSLNPVPDPNSATFGADCYPFTQRMAAAGEAMNLLAAELNTALNLSLLGVTSSSTTSLTIGTGSKTLTVGTGLGYAVGMPLKIPSAANVANFMKGVVTAYNSGTGSLTVNVASIGGSGTFADWAVFFDIPDAGSGFVPIGGLVANKNRGNSFTENGTTYLKTGVISPTATYPLAPTTTINDGSTWLSKTGVAMINCNLASNGSGTVLGMPRANNDANYAISTDYGATWSTATFPAAISGIPVWCGSFFLIVNVNGGAASTTFYTSTTGATGSWTARTVPSNVFVNAVYGAQGCIITTSTTQGYLTTDGINYTSITMPAANLSGCFGNGFYVFLTPSSSTTTCYKTANGSTFVTKTLPVAVAGNGTWDRPITFGEGAFLWAQSSAVAKCFTTADFETFSINDTGIPLTNTYLRVFGNGTFLLINPFGSSTCYTSDNQGVTWTPRTFISSANFPAVAFTGTSFVALEYNSTNATQSVSGGTYTDTAKAMFADSPENTRPFYMRVA